MQEVGAEFSLLFPSGQRPEADAVSRLLDSPPGAGVPARVSHRPEGEADWLELLSSGLTFDLLALSPGPPGEVPPAGQRYGLNEMPAADLESISLRPGPHLASGGATIPVVRIMAGLAARLASGLGAVAVCWRPAGTWMEPAYFARTVDAWLAGGVFPALGLTAIERTADGGVASAGLSFFIGQELHVGARPGEAATDCVKLAVRAIDLLVRQGPLRTRTDLSGPAGEPLVAEPSADGRIVSLRREP